MLDIPGLADALAPAFGALSVDLALGDGEANACFDVGFSYFGEIETSVCARWSFFYFSVTVSQ